MGPIKAAQPRRARNAIAFFVALGFIAAIGLYSRGPAPFFESPEDARTRAALVGSWTWRFDDADTRDEVTLVTMRRADGTWREQTTTRSQAGEVIGRYDRRGRWFVASGVLKTHTLYVNDQAIGRNSRLAFQNYPIESINPESVRYRIARSNGQPGQWQRVFEREPEAPEEQEVVEERRIDRPPSP